MNFIIFVCCPLPLSWRKPVIFGFPQDTQFSFNTSIPPASNFRPVDSTAHPVFLDLHPLSSPEGFSYFEALIHHRVIFLVALTIVQSPAHLNSPRVRVEAQKLLHLRQTKNSVTTNAGSGLRQKQSSEPLVAHLEQPGCCSIRKPLMLGFGEEMQGGYLQQVRLIPGRFILQ